MPTFTGQLNSNEIFASLFNMIIRQQVFADNIASNDNSKFVDEAKTEGSLYGDTILYYSTDVLKSRAWLNDAEASNLLKINRPKAPDVQAIELDTFRQIDITVDEYLSKRAWQSADAFSQFNSVILGWIRETKKIYDLTTYNTYLGTAVATDQKVNTIQVNLTANNNTAGENLALEIANLLDDLSIPSRDYNSYKNLRSYNSSDVRIIWNKSYANEVKKIDLPSIFHNEGMVEKNFADKLHSQYFGTVNSSSGTTASNNTTTGAIRAMAEIEYQVANAAADTRAYLNPDDNNYYVHLFAGDVLPNSTAYAANATYTLDSDIIAKVLVKLPPFMSAFEVGTSFFNPRSLTTNHYLTYGHNTLEFIKNYPLIVLKKASS